MRAPAALDEPGSRRDLVGAVDRDVQLAQVLDVAAGERILDHGHRRHLPEWLRGGPSAIFEYFLNHGQ